MDRTRIYGLTGNMGCGKTRVASFFSMFEDVMLLRADEIAKEILFDEANIPKLSEMFGVRIFQNGQVDRVLLAQLVFNDEKAMQKLETFIHPLALEEILRRVHESDSKEFAIVEAALLFEAGWEQEFDGVIVAFCDEEEQYRRNRSRGKMAEEEIEKRLARQWPMTQKIQKADFTIDTSGTLLLAKHKVEALYRHLKTIHT